ncbi:hypothetical protein AgCh_019802 [Apium graveolens]
MRRYAQRVGSGSPVYLSAVLEYLTAEVFLHLHLHLQPLIVRHIPVWIVKGRRPFKPLGVDVNRQQHKNGLKAYQILAVQGNEEAERILNLVYTTQSLQRANDAITAIPSITGSDFELAEDSFGDAGGDDEEDTMSIGGDADTSTNASTKRLLTTHLEALQLHKIQALQYSQSVVEIKQEVSEVKQDFIARLDARLPGTTMTEIAQKLRKEADLNRKVEAVDSKLSDVEKSMAKILTNQETQTALLQQLVAAQLPSTLQLDADKKGEKGTSSDGEKQLNIQISKVILPIIAFTKPPAMDNIDIINLAAAKLETNDKLLKIDVAVAEKELKEK